VLGRGAVYHRARGRSRDALVGALWRAYTRGGKRGPVDGEFAEHVADRAEFEDFLAAWWPTLTPRAVLRALADPRRLARAASGVLAQEDIDRIAPTFRDGLTANDVALLDEIRELLGRPPRPPAEPTLQELTGIAELTTYAERVLDPPARQARREDYDEYAHLVVDEAQDLTPMQWRMLGRRGRLASWTVVGDAAQSLWPDPDEAAQARDAALGRLPRHDYRLTTNYRNPAEIFELAAQVVRAAVPDADLPRAVRTTGHLPRLVTAAAATLAVAVPKEVAELLAEVEGALGVVAAQSRRAEVAGWLAGADARVAVVDEWDVKGLEYDGVLLVEPAQLVAAGPMGVRALYVALTRATQRLVAVGSDASWLPGISHQLGNDSGPP
jgi:hypothetical protein